MTWPVMKAIWGQPGGKRALAKQLLKMMTPQHDTYTEAFAGSAAVLMSKEPVGTEMLNDSNSEIAFAFKAIQSLSEQEMNELRKKNWTGSKKLWHKLKHADPGSMSKVDRLHRWLYLSRFSSGGFAGHSYNNQAEGQTASRVAKVEKFKPRLEKVHVMHGDYAEALKKFDGAKAMHYLDPPYADNSDKEKAEGSFDERRFRSTLKSLKGNFLVTYGYRGQFPKLARESGFHMKKLNVKNPYGAARGASNTLGTIIVSNYDLASKSDLQDAILDEDDLEDGWTIAEWSEADDAWLEDMDKMSEQGVDPFAVKVVVPDALTLDPNSGGILHWQGHEQAIEFLQMADPDIRDADLRTCKHHAGLHVPHRSGYDLALIPSTDHMEMRQPETLVGTLDFYEGDEGTCVVEQHERGLTEEQLKLESGWQVEAEQIGDKSELVQLLRGLHNADWATALKDAAYGQPETLGELVKSVEPPSDEEEKAALANVSPITRTTRLKFYKSGEEHWEGGDVPVPGDQFSGLGIGDIDDVAESDAVSFSMNVSRVPTAKGGDNRIVKSYSDGDQMGEEHVSKSSDGRYTRSLVVDRIRWTAGKQTETRKEFHLEDGDYLSGWYVLKREDEHSTWGLEKGDDRGPLRKYLDDGEVEEDFSLYFQILQKDKTGKFVTGPVLIPENEDAQNDVVGKEDIQEAAYDFLAKYNKGTLPGIMHKKFDVDVDVVESWVTKEDGSMGGTFLPKGTWMMTQRNNSEKIRRMVREGKLKGFSIGGTGQRVPEND